MTDAGGWQGEASLDETSRSTTVNCPHHSPGALRVERRHPSALLTVPRKDANVSNQDL